MNQKSEKTAEAETIVREVLVSYFRCYAIPANITLDPYTIDRMSHTWAATIIRGTVFSPGLLVALANAGFITINDEDGKEVSPMT